MEVGNALNTAENAVRDLIERLLRKKYGEERIDRLGVTEDRIHKWKTRIEEEPQRRPGGIVEQRLIYYAEFYDLVTIINKNWDAGFKDCFGEKKQFNVYMDRLNAFRNPDAHSRALFPFEEHLVLGITGEIRQSITMFMSRDAGSAEPEYFSRIEEIRDNYGMRAVGMATGAAYHHSPVVLRPGTTVLFLGKAWDPDNSSIEWTIESRVGGAQVSGTEIEWQWQVDERDISESAEIRFSIVSGKTYHRHSGFDVGHR